MYLDEIKRDINLIDYAKTHWDLKIDLKGNGSCPFHPPDNHNSFSIWQDDKEFWRFKCFHGGLTGTIVDLKAKLDNKSEEESIKELLEEFGDRRPEIKEKKRGKKSFYVYKDIYGKEVYRKVKLKYEDGSKSFWFEIKDKTGWRKPKVGEQYKKIPYNLDKFKEHTSVIICEGEKDADTVEALSLGYLTTSAPCGKGSWNDNLTKYFKGKKEITFLYDVGNEEDAKRHAAKLKEAFPEMQIYIARVPLAEPEADITDYLEQRNDLKLKQIDFSDIIEKREEFEFRKQGIFIGSLEEFMEKSIPKNENLIDPIVFRGGLTEIGGVKGSHKSFFVNLLGLHLASCKSPFLKFAIEKPGKVLLIQQEVSEGFMQERLKKITKSEIFNTEERFYPITTTGKPLKLLYKEDFDQIKEFIDKYEPDNLILDPLSSFNTSEENMSKDMSKIVSRLLEIKSKYNIGLVITHHFSSKVNPNDPNAPSEAGGWFRGHTTFTDAADVLVCLHRLPGQRENPNLPKAYEDYNLVQVELRNGKWPERFAIEFDEETFILKESDIWQEIGKKILPGQIEELIEANNGEMFQKDVIDYFKSTARPTTVKNAIREAILHQKTIEKDILSGRGNPVLLKLKK